MKIGTVHCPSCSSTWIALFPEDMLLLPCPFCEALNGAPEDAQFVSGMCIDCGMALDDHLWDGPYVIECPAVHELSGGFDWPPFDHRVV
jgi:hypothetical protein